MSWSDAIKQSLKKPAFMAVLLVLLVGAVGINAATSAMKLHFRKEALPLRAQLDTLPQEFGSWVAVPERAFLDPEIEHSLGTDKYVFRDYVDTSVTSGGVALITKDDVKKLADLPAKERHVKLMEFRSQAARAGATGAVVSLAVTYYTGKVDTVPHVPDRCYVADGYQPSAYEVKEWKLGAYTSGETRSVPSRFIDFEDQTSRGAQNRCVAYFFHANGEYQHDPNQVRVKLQNLFEKYAYFAKIEVMTLLPSKQAGAIVVKDDRGLAEARMKKFLEVALPEVEKVLPVMPGR